MSSSFSAARNFVALILETLLPRFFGVVAFTCRQSPRVWSVARAQLAHRRRLGAGPASGRRSRRLYVIVRINFFRLRRSFLLFARLPRRVRHRIAGLLRDWPVILLLLREYGKRSQGKALVIVMPKPANQFFTLMEYRLSRGERESPSLLT